MQKLLLHQQYVQKDFKKKRFQQFKNNSIVLISSHSKHQRFLKIKPFVDAKTFCNNVVGKIKCRLLAPFFVPFQFCGHKCLSANKLI